jgi:CubicO group peptidase (beta-lactamase class C family)
MDRRGFITAAAACSVVSASTLPVARAQQPPARFSEAIAYSADRGGTTFLVVRNGVVLGEAYQDGNADTRWPIGEGTHAMMPLLMGALVSDRLLRLDDPVSMTLGVWSDPERQVISTRTLLNGTSGISFGPNDTHDLNTALTLQPPPAQGVVRFSDDAATYFLLAEIARRKLLTYDGATDPAQYLTDRVLGPIGCVPVGWTRNPDGSARFDDGCAVSARGWAEIGELIRRNGVWRAEQIVDNSTMMDTLRGSLIEPRAGFGFWLASATRRSDGLPVNSDLWSASSPAPVDLAMAAGAQGQRLYVVPSRDLVIVRQTRANVTSAPPWSDAAFLTTIWRNL